MLGRFVCADCSVETTGRVHIQLAGMDPRVSWWTQRETEGHIGK